MSVPEDVLGDTWRVLSYVSVGWYGFMWSLGALGWYTA